MEKLLADCQAFVAEEGVVSGRELILLWWPCSSGPRTESMADQPQHQAELYTGKRPERDSKEKEIQSELTTSMF